MEHSIREARPEDLAPLYQLLLGKAEFDQSLEKVRVDESNFGRSLFGSDPRESAIVAEVGGQLVGFATFFPIYFSYLGCCLWLDDLFVLASHRGAGIGRHLLSRVAQIAATLGASRIDWTVAADNTRGRSFYEQIGATVVETSRVVRLPEAGIAALAREAEPAAQQGDEADRP